MNIKGVVFVIWDNCSGGSGDTAHFNVYTTARNYFMGMAWQIEISIVRVHVLARYLC